MVVPEAFWAPPEPSWRPTKPYKMQQKHCNLQYFVLLSVFAYAPRSEAQKDCKRRPTGAQNEPQAQPNRPQEQPKRPQEQHRRPPERPKRYPTSPSERFSLPNGIHLALKSPPEASKARSWTPREPIFLRRSVFRTCATLRTASPNLSHGQSLCKHTASTARRSV